MNLDGEIKVILFTSKHENRGLREAELVHQQILHAFSIVNTPLKLVLRVLIRNAAYQSTLPPMCRRKPPRRYMIVRRWNHIRRKSRTVMLPGGARRWGGGAWLSYARDRVAYGAAYGRGSRRKLQLLTALGAVYQQRHHFRKLVGSARRFIFFF